jgi:hypothetical protein
VTERTHSADETRTSEQATKPRHTKSAAVHKLLLRAKGATLAEIMDATGWQPHSARAFLTGLRKKGTTIVREARQSGETSWRIER